MWREENKWMVQESAKNPEQKEVADRQQKWAWGAEKKEGVKERKQVSTKSEIVA